MHPAGEGVGRRPFLRPPGVKRLAGDEHEADAERDEEQHCRLCQGVMADILLRLLRQERVPAPPIKPPLAPRSSVMSQEPSPHVAIFPALLTPDTALADGPVENSAAARLAIVTKQDFTPHCDVNLADHEANLPLVDPGGVILRLSSRKRKRKTGQLD